MPVGLLHLDIERNVKYHNARLLDILYGSDALTSETDAVDALAAEPAERRERRRQTL